MIVTILPWDATAMKDTNCTGRFAGLSFEVPKTTPFDEIMSIYVCGPFEMEHKRKCRR
jgi:hypothetical protein